MGLDLNAESAVEGLLAIIVAGMGWFMSSLNTKIDDERKAREEEEANLRKEIESSSKTATTSVHELERNTLKTNVDLVTRTELRQELDRQTAILLSRIRDAEATNARGHG
jgi:hypothetical protein